MKRELAAKSQVRLTATANADVRYSFTVQFVEAATQFAKRARSIEQQGIPADGDEATELRCEHRGAVSAAVMQCAAALETEVHEICVYGPGCHLGSDRTDHAARRLLGPIAHVIDRESTLARFDLILYLLGKAKLDKGCEPFQGADLLVKLRNEVTHFKSVWGSEMERKKLIQSLRQLGHNRPPFVSENASFFPHQCLSADCAAWAVRSTVAFLELIYQRLGVGSCFEANRSRVTF